MNIGIIRILACLGFVLFAGNAFAQTPCASQLPGVNNSAPHYINICSGGGFSVTPGISSLYGYSFQWERSTGGAFADISGETNVGLTPLNPDITMDGYQYRLRVSNGTCHSYSYVSFLHVIERPSIVSQPQSVLVCPGDVAGFGVSASDISSSLPLSYGWRTNNGAGTPVHNMPGEVNSTLSVATNASMNNYTYGVSVTNAFGCTTASAVASIALNNTPIVITTQPTASQAVCEGSGATFKVVIAGTGGGVRYQWKKNGIDIPGALASIYTIPITSTAHAGIYSVEITGACDAPVISNPAILIINEKPEILTNPDNQTICTAQPVTFTVDAGVTTNASYQWRKGGVNIPGAVGASYMISNVTTAHAGNYTVVVNGTCSPSRTSSVAKLTVNVTPSISIQPSPHQVICEGTGVHFSVLATGSMITYQWQKNGIDITGATLDLFSIPSATPSDAGNYSVSINGIGTCPTAFSNIAQLVVEERARIVAQPSQVTLCENQEATFAVDAGTTTRPTYLWQTSIDNIVYTNIIDNTIYAGSTSSRLTLTNTPAAYDGYFFRAIINGACASHTVSTPTTLTVQENPEIIGLLNDQTICENANTVFTVNAGRTTSPVYQWQVSSDRGSTFSNIENNEIYEGSGTATLSITNASRNVSGFQYRTVISGICVPKVNSNMAMLTVNHKPEIPTNGQPANTRVCEQADAVFSVSHGTTTAPTFQWQASSDGGITYTSISDNHLYQGSTASVFTVKAPTQTSNNFKFRVVVSGTCAPGILSVPATLTIKELPEIDLQPSPQKICEGDNINLSVKATGDELTYQWKKDNFELHGETSPTLELASADQQSNGNYTVVVKNDCNTTGLTSLPAMVTIMPLPKISAGTDKEVIIRNSITLEGEVMEGRNLAFIWGPRESLNDFSILKPLASPRVNTHYTLLATDENGCSASDEVYVKVLTPLTIPNAFSPNNDGINDTWQIDNLQFFPQYSIHVFNRYGEKVFHSEKDSAWNGTYHGKDLPWGTYYYLIDLKDGQKPFSGWVEIIK